MVKPGGHHLVGRSEPDVFLGGRPGTSPPFEDFPVVEIYQGAPAPLDLADKPAVS